MADEVVTGSGEVSLAALVWAVRQQLHEAQAYGHGDGLRFGVDTITLEIAVEATATKTRTAGGEAALNFKVLDLVGIELSGKGDASWERGRTSTARITVQITPRDTRHPSGRTEISGRDTEPPPNAATP